MGIVCSVADLISLFREVEGLLSIFLLDCMIKAVKPEFVIMRLGSY